MTARTASFAGLLALMLVACAPKATIRPEDGEDWVSDGKAIAQSQCSACHAVGSSGDSPRPDAPPLRTVLSRYDEHALSDAFINGIKVGHPDMPEFELTPTGADRLIAYLKSIETKPQP